MNTADQNKPQPFRKLPHIPSAEHIPRKVSQILEESTKLRTAGDVFSEQAPINSREVSPIVKNAQDWCRVRIGVQHEVNPGFECKICYDSEAGLQSFAMKCGHRFCVNCYAKYLGQKVKETGEAVPIKCPEYGCNMVMDFDLPVTANLQASLNEVVGRDMPSGYALDGNKLRERSRHVRPSSIKHRYVSTEPVRINFPETENNDAFALTYSSKCQALADMYEKNTGQFSACYTFDPSDRTYQLYPKNVALPHPNEVRSRGFENLWLPIRLREVCKETRGSCSTASFGHPRSQEENNRHMPMAGSSDSYRLPLRSRGSSSPGKTQPTEVTTLPFDGILGSEAMESIAEAEKNTVSAASDENIPSKPCAIGRTIAVRSPEPLPHSGVDAERSSQRAPSPKSQNSAEIKVDLELHLSDIRSQYSDSTDSSLLGCISTDGNEFVRPESANELWCTLKDTQLSKAAKTPTWAELGKAYLAAQRQSPYGAEAPKPTCSLQNHDIVGEGIDLVLRLNQIDSHQALSQSSERSSINHAENFELYEPYDTTGAPAKEPSSGMDIITAETREIIAEGFDSSLLHQATPSLGRGLLSSDGFKVSELNSKASADAKVKQPKDLTELFPPKLSDTRSVSATSFASGFKFSSFGDLLRESDDALEDDITVTVEHVEAVEGGRHPDNFSSSNFGLDKQDHNDAESRECPTFPLTRVAAEDLNLRLVGKAARDSQFAKQEKNGGGLVDIFQARGLMPQVLRPSIHRLTPQARPKGRSRYSPEAAAMEGFDAFGTVQSARENVFATIAGNARRNLTPTRHGQTPLAPLLRHASASSDIETEASSVFGDPLERICRHEDKENDREEQDAMLYG